MGAEILRQIQSISSPALDAVFSVVTMLGDRIVLAGCFCAIYWCLDRKTGRWLMQCLCASLCLNGIIKDAFQVARPIGQEGIVSRMANTATGHSFPSGHTQSAATFWWGCALRGGKKHYRLMALVIILGVGFSRMYLGLHYPTDVLGGAVLGILISSLLHRLDRAAVPRFVIPLVCLVLAVTALLTGSSEDTLAAGMLTLGAVSGMWFEERFVRFRTDVPLLRRLLRLVLGGGVLGLLYLGTSLLLPADPLLKAGVLGVIVFGGTALCPWLFVKIRL